MTCPRLAAVSLAVFLSWTSATAAEVVDAGDVLEVPGPAVVLDERAYRDYVRDSRRGDACREQLGRVLDDLDASRERTTRAVEIARAQMDVDEQAAEDLRTALERSERSRARLVGQRSVLLGVVAGVVAGASVAVLSR